MFRLLTSLVAFAVGVTLALAAEFALLLLVGWLFDTVISPRGLWWIIMPIASGFAFVNISKTISPSSIRSWSRIFFALLQASIWARAYIAICVLWFGIFSLYTFVYKEHYSYYNRVDFEWVAKWYGLPAVATLVAVLLIKWVVRNKTPSDIAAESASRKYTREQRMEAYAMGVALAESEALETLRRRAYQCFENDDSMTEEEKRRKVEEFIERVKRSAAATGTESSSDSSLSRA